MRRIAVAQEHTCTIWEGAVVEEHKADPHFLSAHLSVLMHLDAEMSIFETPTVTEKVKQTASPLQVSEDTKSDENF